MSKNTSLLTCCICDGEIDIQPNTGWSEGHNASPVVALDLNDNEYKDENGKVVSHGRCCSVCNNMEVIPARLKSFQLS